MPGCWYKRAEKQAAKVDLGGRTRGSILGGLYRWRGVLESRGFVSGAEGKEEDLPKLLER